MSGRTQMFKMVHPDASQIPDCAGLIGWMSAFHIDKTHTKVQNSTKRTTIVNRLKTALYDLSKK